MSSKTLFASLMRTPENGGRRSRTLRLDDESAQVQAKEMWVHPDGELAHRFLVVRYWVSDSEQWTHLIVDGERPGLAGITSVGFGMTEAESWDMCRDAFERTTDISI